MIQHLEHLTIEQFRGLRDLELKDLGQVNLFVGPNNSGKTSVLEAIATYCRPLDALEWLTTSKRRESGASGLMAIARLNSLRWLFPQSTDQSPDGLYHGQTRVQASGTFAVTAVTANYQEIRGVPDEATLRRVRPRPLLKESDETLVREPEETDSREADETYQGAELQVAIQARPVQMDLFGPERSSEDLQANFVFWEAAPFYERKKAPARHSLPVRTITPVSHRTDRSQVSRFSEAALNREIDAVLEPLRLFDPDITGLQVLESGGTSLYVDHKRSGLTPLSAFGDGVRRVVMMALTLPRVREGVLLIDEIETAIHISVLKEVYHWLFAACQQYNIQLFATTHSLEAIDALLMAHPTTQDGLVTYLLGQPGKSAKRFSGELLRDFRFEGGLDVRTP